MENNNNNKENEEWNEREHNSVTLMPDEKKGKEMLIKFLEEVLDDVRNDRYYGLLTSHQMIKREVNMETNNESLEVKGGVVAYAIPKSVTILLHEKAIKHIRESKEEYEIMK